jgi:hypothetical protein
MDLKRRFEKEKKKKTKPRTLYLFGPDSPARPPLPAHYPSSLSLFFCSGADRWAPPVSLQPPLPFLLPRARAGRRRIPPRPALSPSFPCTASMPIKAITLPLNPTTVSLSNLKPGRPAGHQWHPAAAPAFSRFISHPRALYKHAHALLGFPFAFAAHTRPSPSSISPAPPLCFPPPPSSRRRR